jgi:hypothetical protein
LIIMSSLVVKNTFLVTLDETGKRTPRRPRAMSEPCIENQFETVFEDDNKSVCSDDSGVLSTFSTITPGETNSDANSDFDSSEGTKTPPTQEDIAPSANMQRPGTFWVQMVPVVVGRAAPLSPQVAPQMPTSPPSPVPALSLPQTASQLSKSSGHREWTTVMLKNIPNDYSRAMVLELFNSEGFCGKYDFVYLPVDFRSGSAFGYAFVNLVSELDCQAFWKHFHGFCQWSLPSKKVAEVTWSKPSQGLAMNMERYRNSSVMHGQVPDEYKPCVFRHGLRVAFAEPTKLLNLPEEMMSAAASTSRNNTWWSTGGSMDHAESGRTTLMLRNLPNDYTRSMLTSMLDGEGFAGMYDFLYLPVDFARGAGIGYAFINMTSHDAALSFLRYFSGFCNWTVPSRKVAEVSWSNPNQGLSVHIERYRNSTVMHASVPDEYKPIVLMSGLRVPFPPPTRTIRAPQA